METREAGWALAALGWLWIATGCGEGGGAPAGTAEEAPLGDLVRRQRVAAHYAEGEFGRAREELRPLVERDDAERDDAALEDLIHAACIDLETEVGDVERARSLLDRAAALAPEDPRVLWNQARLVERDLPPDWLQRKAALLERVHAQAPDDIATNLALGGAYWDIALDLEDEDAVAAQARRTAAHYQRVLDLGPDFGGSWYATANYRMWRFLIESEGGAGDAFREEWERMGRMGITSARSEDVERGTFGAVPALSAVDVYPRPDSETDGLPLPDWKRGTPVPVRDGAGVRGTLLVALESGPVDEARKIGQLGSLGYAFSTEAIPASLIVYGDEGLTLRRWSGAGWGPDARLVEQPVTAAAAFDLGIPGVGGEGGEGGDADLDFVVALEDGLLLLENRGDGWHRRGIDVVLGGGVADIEPVDYDHEGDIDLLVVGSFGARLLRNDAAHLADGGFVDATQQVGLPPIEGAATWCLVEDFDGDNDADLLYGGPAGVRLADNLREGRFGDLSDRLPPALLAATEGREPRVGDIDGDGLVDLAPDGTLFAGTLAGEWTATADRPAARHLLAHAVNPLAGTRTLDVDGDQRPDRVHHLHDTVAFERTVGGPPGVTLSLRGKKDNARGKGAVVEVVLGGAYSRLYWDGQPHVIATHGAATLDVVRISWPNGVLQSLVDLPTDRGPLVIRQREGLVGSCPFLYTWNGEEFVFVSDVLGITPLGLPMAPGMLVPPDHDEVVLVRGDQLVPRDGVYTLQFTEELREVTYLDRIRLDVVDHPAGSEIYPNERFTFPPFPEAHTHTVRAPLAPTAATGSDGADWTAALASDDGDFAMPFEPYTGQYLGLTDPHFVELTFDADAVARAEKLRLLMTGWLYWTDASVNIASAGHPTIEFLPPLLQVPDGNGGWRATGPPVGFPAGKTKTMVLDVTDVLNRADPRLRVSTTLRLYWDSIRLATDADDAELRVTSIEPTSADLWMRGFSKELAYCGRRELAWFAWDQLEEEPRWNQHPGRYTKLGECVPLVTAIDDMLVVMGSGEALTVTFDADSVPPLAEGWTRDYLVFLDGWAKDRDPNTHGALFVEPLPFHGMRGYPYGADEAFPDDPEHRAWRREWLTRPAKRWIEDLRPAAAAAAPRSAGTR